MGPGGRGKRDRHTERDGRGRGRDRDRDSGEKSTTDQTGIRGLTATGLFADLFSPKLAAVNMELKINLTKVRVTPFVCSQEFKNISRSSMDTHTCTPNSLVYQSQLTVSGLSQPSD